MIYIAPVVAYLFMTNILNLPATMTLSLLCRQLMNIVSFLLDAQKHMWDKNIAYDNGGIYWLSKYVKDMEVVCYIVQSFYLIAFMPCPLQAYICKQNHDIIFNAVFKIRSKTCQTKAQFCVNSYMTKKESLQHLPKFCPSGSAVQHFFQDC